MRFLEDMDLEDLWVEMVIYDLERWRMEEHTPLKINIEPRHHRIEKKTSSSMFLHNFG